MGHNYLVSASHYLPFGQYRDTPPSQAFTELGYTGHYENRDLGLTYMNARFYVVGIGRFASADTLIPDPANPQAHNRYSYVLGNPINLVDPTGHCVEAFEGASREDNLQGNDKSCWGIYYDRLDAGYIGLDPSWDYTRVDLWLLEELHFQYGLSFASIWMYHWAIDNFINPGDTQRCYEGCAISYERLYIDYDGRGNEYMSLLLNGKPAWLFTSYLSVIDPVRGPVDRPHRGIGTDPNGYLREAMQNYGTAHSNSMNGIRDTFISGIGTVASLGVVFTPASPLGWTGLVFSATGLYFSVTTMTAGSSDRQDYLRTITQAIYALEVRIYD